MKAVKGNKVYTINETQKRFYEESGFDILNDEGAVIAYGRGKSVPYGDYVALKEEKRRLEQENRSLSSKLEEQKAETASGETSNSEPAVKRGKTPKAGE